MNFYYKLMYLGDEEKFPWRILRWCDECYEWFPVGRKWQDSHKAYRWLQLANQWTQKEGTDEYSRSHHE